MNHTALNTHLQSRLTALSELGGFDGQLIDRFATYLASAPDEQLFRANPYQFAQVAAVSPQRALDLFLYATHTGIFDLNWGVICPSCSSFITTEGGLRSLRGQSHCSICSLDVEVSPDDNIEVAFTVAPAVRRIRFHSPDTLDMESDWYRVLFSTNLAYLDSVMQQARETLLRFCRLPGGASETLRVALEPGLYRLIAPREHSVAYVEVQPDAPLREVTFDLYEGRFVPDAITLRAGEVTLNVRNRSGHTAVYALMHDMPTMMMGRMSLEEIQRAHLMNHYVTAKQIAMSQVFRDLFRAESIPSELGVSFKSVTFLFSDLKGSTQLYERVGDIRAYQLVREHFTLLQDIIAELGGSVVKTIGDAVMATFAEPLPAVQAALLMNREVTRLGLDESLRIKIGLHAGSCIAVESNDRLDYFGRTVNIAARVQGIAEAGEIVITDPIYAAAGVTEMIRAEGMQMESYCGALRGIADEMQFHRVK